MPLDVQSIAARHGFTPEAVVCAWNALRHSGGHMAQFYHYELGGGGQWMPGMLMIGDMFNNQLKGRVDNLFRDLVQQPVDPEPTPITPLYQPHQSFQQQSSDSGYAPNAGSSFSYGGPVNNGNWYPADLGYASTTGSQNNVRYAYFPETCRLAIELFGRVTIYDTGNHHIGGVSQGQSSDTGSMTFTSQFGTIPLSSLRMVG